MASAHPRSFEPSHQEHANTLDAGRSVIRQEADGLAALAVALDQSFSDAVGIILATQGRVIVAGIGKSGHVGRKIAATFAATGTTSFFLHASEAAHGDLGMVTEGDLLLILSNSGHSRELRPLLAYASRQGIPVIGVVSKRNSPLGLAADIVLQLPSAQEACPERIAPTTSTTMMIALGDALAMATMQRRGLTRNDIAQWHPGGAIGSRIAPIEELISFSDPLPLVRWDTPMRDIVFEMTSGGKGVAGVVGENGDLLGVITDGDLRRAFDQVLTARASDIMTRNPITVPLGTPVEEVLTLMNNAKITVVFITEVDASARPVGIVHIHDLVP
ncbi:MAG: KpsF/GutQ family sugar-phosphate isomerase [Alphaproteobacteria bacterium]|jgi:KpsF/GutQ family protein|nr:KpsF/GutQ family sugar-phosphate isomerase [Alphaproteobacteria bacterium]MBU0877237.1 KpsF/GutQ family sugar-phosphate isomerase [Alphaproteobacteria bacterium]MBU1770613.1 KpsF/GutQ family sugar-phosphate isomerase [Alphaproteobacteria bacterium]